MVLDNCPNCFNIFISADVDFAKKRVAEEFHLTEDEAINYIKKKTNFAVTTITIIQAETGVKLPGMICI